jgi:hypothetical protein
MNDIPQEDVEAAAKALMTWMRLPGWKDTGLKRTTPEQYKRQSGKDWARVVLEVVMPSVAGVPEAVDAAAKALHDHMRSTDWRDLNWGTDPLTRAKEGAREMTLVMLEAASGACHE